MAPLRIPVTQRRARLARRHRLAGASRAGTPTDAAAGVVALHATDPASVHLAAIARCAQPAIAATEQALYVDRTLVRMLGMRRTVFVVPHELAPVVQSACTRDIADRERRRVVSALADDGIDQADAWLAEVEDATVAALESRGEALATELTGDVPRLGHTMTVVSGRQTYQIRLSTRVLFLLAAAGRIVRGRPRGTWLSSQYRWAPMRGWLGVELDDVPVERASAILAERWLRAFGPATAGDLQWWTGWTTRRTRAALGGLATVDVDLDGTPGLVLADDTDPVDEPEPWAALLPALDPTAMGWRARDWYLGSHREALFDRTGNIGPTVWWNGRIVGGWGQDRGGAVVHEMLEDVGADAVAAVAAEARRLEACLDGVTVTPRFHTPLERMLTT